MITPLTMKKDHSVSSVVNCMLHVEQMTTKRNLSCQLGLKVEKNMLLTECLEYTEAGAFFADRDYSYIHLPHYLALPTLNINI